MHKRRRGHRTRRNELERPSCRRRPADRSSASALRAAPGGGRWAAAGLAPPLCTGGTSCTERCTRSRKLCVPTRAATSSPFRGASLARRAHLPHCGIPVSSGGEAVAADPPLYRGYTTSERQKPRDCGDPGLRPRRSHRPSGPRADSLDVSTKAIRGPSRDLRYEARRPPRRLEER